MTSVPLNPNQIAQSSQESEKLLDAVSWGILAELQENARLSYSELGRRVGLTPTAVAERIRRLEDAGVITGYRVELNLAKLGLPLLLIIRLTAPEGRCGQFSRIAGEIPEILECHRVTGTDSYVIKAAVPSVQHVEGVIDRLTAYGGTTTAVVLSSPVTHRTIAPDSIGSA